MDKIFELATSISTPLALSGFFAAIVFYIFRQIVAKNIFPKLTAAVGARVLRFIIEKLFILALVAMVLGFIAYLATVLLPHRPEAGSEQSRLETLVGDLESSSMERRILSASLLGNIEPKSGNEADNLVRVLESFINRRGALGKNRSNDNANQDLSAALTSLSSILKNADAHSFHVHPPELTRVNLSFIDLSNMYMRRASFLDSDLNDTILNKADFSNALFTGVQFSNAQAQGINLASARIQQSCVEESIFDDADLSCLETSSSDFNGSSFKNSKLSSASFKNTRLSFVNLEGADLTHTDLGTALELTTRQLQQARFADTATLPNPLFTKSRLTICRIK